MVTKKFNFFQLRSKLQFWFSEDYLLGVKVMKSSRYSHFIYHEIPAATAVIKYFLVLQFCTLYYSIHYNHGQNTSYKLSDIQVVESLLKVKPYYTCKKGLPLLHSDFFCKCNILHIPELFLWSNISLIWTNRYLSTINQSINCFSTNIKLNQFLYITLLIA